MTDIAAAAFPLLEQTLSIRGLPLKAVYSTRDVATIFQVSPRAIQHRIASGQLKPRDLPGRAKFLPGDIEDLLVSSQNRRRQHAR